MLPSAAAFVDPLFSTGIPLTLLGIERLGRILAESWDSYDLSQRLEEYERATTQEADWTARFISASYAAFPQFTTFAALSMFYFAAASYSEMARRLDRPRLVQRFLAADHPDFAPAMAACEDAVHAGAPRDFEQKVAAAIAPLNVAGLSDPSKRNWYGVDLNDLIHSAEKLGFTPNEMRRVLPNPAAPFPETERPSQGKGS
jgi:FADH2 O2-dependent halogenase